jgi:hypothetical protein
MSGLTFLGSIRPIWSSVIHFGLSMAFWNLMRSSQKYLSLQLLSDPCRYFLYIKDLLTRQWLHILSIIMAHL